MTNSINPRDRKNDNTAMDDAHMIAMPVGLFLSIGQAETVAEILNCVARWLPVIIEADRASITIAVGDKHLRLFAIEGNGAIPAGKVMPVDGTMIGRVFKSQTLEVANDLSAPEVAGDKDCQMLRNAGLNSCIDAPLKSGDECYGTLNIAHSQAHFFSAHDATALECLAQWVAAHIRINRQVQDMSALAMTDPLTALLNRRAFLNIAERTFDAWCSTQHNFVAAMLDIDHFKWINDQHGHAAGDKVLSEFAAKLESLVRKGDHVARLGGEEFAVILTNMAPEVAHRWAERVVEDIGDLCVEYESHQLSFTVSVGLSVPRTTDENIECVLKRADEALYLSKDAGRNRVSRVA